MTSTHTRLIVHVIFSTKYREPLLQQDLRHDVHAYMAGTIKGEGASAIAIGGIQDHAHLVMGLRPDQSVAELVRRIKTNSSRWVNENRRLMGRFAWQKGYGATSVSPSQITRVAAYVGRQEEHHRTMTYKEEFELFLKRSGIAFEAQYLWR